MIKVMQWGFGALGSGMVKLMLERQEIKLVGVVDSRTALQRKDVGKLLGMERNIGVLITDDPEAILEKEKPDITLVTAGSLVDRIFDQLKLILAHQSNCITTAEEMAYPWHSHAVQSRELDDIAKKNGVSLLGMGVNPGFVMDLLILVLSGVCGRIRKIRAVRVSDLASFGANVLKKQGVGTSINKFYAGIKQGTIVGHIGSPQLIAMIADVLGWKLDEIVEKKEAILSMTYRETPHVVVEPGMVAGCRQLGYGIMNGKTVIELEHPQQIHPEFENAVTGDYIIIEGDTLITMSNKPEIPDDKGTINLCVNMISHVVHSRAGLVTMLDLPLPIPFSPIH